MTTLLYLSWRSLHGRAVGWLRLMQQPKYLVGTLAGVAWMGPSVTAGLKRTGPPGARDSGYAVTATLGVPLFNRGQAQVDRAEAARARVQADRLVLASRIESEVRVAQAAAAGYRELVDSYRADSVDRAAELAAIATAAYEEGEFGILELLDAHRVTLSAGLRLLELSAAARRGAIELDRAIGGETTS